MELLVGAIVTLAGQAFKWLAGKMGKDLAKQTVIIGVFVMSLIGTVVYLWVTQKTINLSDWQMLVQIWGLAVLWYELIVKRLSFLQV